MAGNYLLTHEEAEQRVRSMLQRAAYNVASAANPVVVTAQEVASQIAMQERADQDRVQMRSKVGK